MSQVQIKALSVSDIPFAMELKSIAGWNQTEEDWEGYLSFESEGCFLAKFNGEKAGTTTTILYENHFGWIGMVLVHPSKRRLGIGTDMPCPNLKGNQLVEKYGFQVQRGFCRMYLGENKFPGDPTRIYGTSGAEKG